MNKVIDIIEKKPNQVELYRELDSLLISAKEELKNDDVQKFQDSVLVAQRSYFLWFSEIDGQRSWFAELKKIDIPDLPKVTEDINWWKVFACDCVGGIFGGPAGYVAASLTSVIMQM